MSQPRLLLGILILAVVGLWGTGCRSRGPEFDPYASSAPTLGLQTNVVARQLDPELLTPSREPFRLGPGDRIDIELLGEEESTTATFVGPDGKVYFHLLPGLPVWGLTLAEVKTRLEEELSTYLHEPQVAVTLRKVESRRVWVMGRVSTPGIYALEGPMTLIEAVTKAGGLFTSRLSGTTEELADLHHSFLVRRGQYLPVDFQRLIREGDASQNIYLEPDDFIYLPSALSTEVYVLGAVRRPSSVAFKDQVTLVSAMAHAGGPIENAWLRGVAIIRGSLSTPSIAVVDYRDVVRGRMPDVPLQPRDIVYVPLSPYRSLQRYAEVAVNTFVRTVAANEGGRAVDPNYRAPGVSVPIGL